MLKRIKRYQNPAEGLPEKLPYSNQDPEDVYNTWWNSKNDVWDKWSKNKDWSNLIADERRTWGEEVNSNLAGMLKLKFNLNDKSYNKVLPLLQKAGIFDNLSGIDDVSGTAQLLNEDFKLGSNTLNGINKPMISDKEINKLLKLLYHNKNLNNLNDFSNFINERLASIKYGIRPVSESAYFTFFNKYKSEHPMYDEFLNDIHDISDAVERTKSYYNSDGFKSRMNAAGLPIPETKDFSVHYSPDQSVAKSYSHSVDNYINIGMRPDRFLKSSLTAAHESGHSLRPFDYNIKTKFDREQMSAEELAEYNSRKKDSPLYLYDYSNVPEEWKQIMGNIQFRNEDDYRNYLQQLMSNDVPDHWTEWLVDAWKRGVTPKTDWDNEQKYLQDEDFYNNVYNKIYPGGINVHGVEYEEQRQYMQEVADEMKRLGIYDRNLDPVTNPFTEEQLEEFKRRVPDWNKYRFLMMHSDEDIIKAMNKIAYNSNLPHFTNMAKRGGILKRV